MKELPTDYSKYIHLSRYSRWNEDAQRRETWEETVDRYIKFFISRFDDRDFNPVKDNANELFNAIINLDVMPSMRALMTAGPALERDHVAGYNCAYRAMKRPNRFSEIMYILMCGTGVGFSVEKQYIEQLPQVAEEFHETETIIKVRDSKIGWASAFKELISLLYSGAIPGWDMSNVRPSGSRLKTFGGRASGPEPLEDLFRFCVETFTKAAGRQLTSIEVHDVVCKIADIVIVGGVRRSALISLSNLTDERMRKAKAGQWWIENPQRALANNSVCYTEKPDVQIYMKEWINLYESKSGERGIYNRAAAQKQAEKTGRRDASVDFGGNPCLEILLRDGQFCNLSECIVRPDDTFEQLKEKVRIAAILGTLQSTLTDFKFISKEWKDNCEEERLLGVSLTGIMDHPVLSDSNDGFAFDAFGTENLGEILQELKEVAIETNKEWAVRLGINTATAITCVKPSGTVSQLVDSSSGIHPRFNKFYIRTVRADKKDPLAQFMIEQGVPHEDEFGKEETGIVFSFPMKAPEGSICNKDVSALEQLELWKIYQDNWCEHKPSITVYYTDDEFLKVGAWVYDNFDAVSGVSFFPHSDHVYKQAPYTAITKEEYDEAMKTFPKVDWEKFKTFEKEDRTTGSQELACAGGACEL